ncbi:MAG: hypothetical protein AB2A00_08515 [Myxococcota bacterium]
MKARVADFRRAFGWGVIASLAMSVTLLLLFVVQRSPMTEPFGVAFVDRLLPGAQSRGALLAISFLAQLLVGGLAAGLVALTRRGLTMWRSFLLAGVMWLVQVFVLMPWAGWGVLATNVDTRIPVATVCLFAVYGSILAYLVEQEWTWRPLSALRFRGY